MLPGRRKSVVLLGETCGSHPLPLKKTSKTIHHRTGQTRAKDALARLEETLTTLAHTTVNV